MALLVATRKPRFVPVALFAMGIFVFALSFFLTGRTMDQTFYASYLVAYQVWFGATLGSLALGFLYTLTGGDWGFAIRRYLMAAVRTLPLLVLLFVPVILAAPDLYPWMDVHEELGPHKRLYFHPTFALLRSVAYFGLWMLLAFLWTETWKRQIRKPDWKRHVRLQRFSAIGLVLYTLSATFAAFDWLMSLTPHWYSTIYGLIVISGQVLSGLSLIVTIALAKESDFLRENTNPSKTRHDLGKLLFAFVMIWAYLSFSQFLIIWSGNLPEEITWYAVRMKTSWIAVSVLVLVLHFALPFALLLSRRAKRHPGFLAGIALLMFCLRFLEMHWLVGPAFDRDALRLTPADLGLPLAIGAVWFGGFFLFLEKRANPSAAVSPSLPP